MQQDVQEKVNRAAKDIMVMARNTVTIDLRCMYSAVTALRLKAAQMGFAVDGRYVYYEPLQVLTEYKEEKNRPAHAYLHMMLHAIFRHFYVNTLLNQEYWTLACDIAVEAIIIELDLRDTKLDVNEERRREIQKLRKRVKLLTAEKLYHLFLNEEPPQAEVDRLLELFHVDDHDIWYMPPAHNIDVNEEEDDEECGDDGGDGIPGEIENVKQRWNSVASKVQMDLENFSVLPGTKAGTMLQNLREVNREKYDYSNFLRRFAVIGEDMHINDEEFDYIFYTYGLNMYGKMPLVEPLEYKEARRVKDFVIAIDTSGSVNSELVQKFLQKTYNILEQQESFFSKINLHIVQCDADIQEDAKISNREEFTLYLKNMKVKGKGGTNFIPVFEHVDELVKNKEFTDLRGLIYFTDGCGIFPETKPDYETAFVFIDDYYNNYDVPVWAIKLILSSEDIAEDEY